ncbi:MAG TPA: gephyrin-like molybdotransferase Glp [Gemmatimonadota bacterium]|nr:gephyrin-like molybdotransferase Glp [Gemmatimonadota bacterium]
MSLTASATLSVREAQARILDRVRPLPAERMTVSAALGRVLARPVFARVDVPPWDNSAMDGYAVRAAEIRPGEPLWVALDLPAGAASGAELPAGTVARIMTGAPLPRGADAVIPVELSEGPDGPGAFAGVGDRVRFTASPAAGDHVRPLGEDVRRGAVAVPEGAVVRAPEVAMAATVGRPTVSVHRRPRVAVVSTGDELVDPEEAGAPDRIVDSNAWGVAARVTEVGGDPLALPRVPDDPEATREAVRAALAADAVVTIGGVSVGARDHVREALEGCGVEIDFWRVALKPGGPAAFGTTADGRPVFALPGNPVSALVTFELFVRPALLRMQGHGRCFRAPLRARLAEAVATRAGKTHYLRGRLTRAGDGWTVTPTGPQGSGLLSSLVAADGLLVVPSEAEGLPAGAAVEVLPLHEIHLEAP